jgi:hypothetical protein
MLIRRAIVLLAQQEQRLPGGEPLFLFARDER